jgi:hypothetical protein
MGCVRPVTHLLYLALTISQLYTQSRLEVFYIPRKYRGFQALKKEIEASPSQTQRLIVYPKLIHFSKKDQPSRLAFQLVGFDKAQKAEAVSGELQDMEFNSLGVSKSPAIMVLPVFGGI